LGIKFSNSAAFGLFIAFRVVFSAADWKAEIVGWVAQKTHHHAALSDPKSKAIQWPALNHTLLVLPFAECAGNERSAQNQLPKYS
jgi:hypothetical protein